MTLSPKAVRAWTEQLLGASGLSVQDASSASDVFLRASMRGLGHHDLSYLPQRLAWLAQGEVNTQPRLTLISESPAAEVWDGDEGLGEVLCSHITRRAMELARKSGVGYAGVRRSNHFLAADPYTQIAAEEGFLALVWSNTDAGMAFPGQSRRQIGNNPLGWGIGEGEASLSADLCLAYSSLGNLKALAESRAEVPVHWGLDAHGAATTRAEDLLAGAVGPIGGPKGLALALLGEVLTGVLTDGATLDQVAAGGGLRTHNQMVLAFDLDWFGGKTAVADRLSSLKTRARAVSGTDRLPGDRSRTAQRDALDQGIALAPTIWEDLADWSRRLDVEIPAKDA